MVYECINCGSTWWNDDCSYVYKHGGSGVIVCPSCEGGLKKKVGDVETAIIDAIPSDSSLSLGELITETGYERQVVKNALRHLIDMGYLGTTPKWRYCLGTKGREKKSELRFD